jgi:PAS domain S-box-containing protein
MEAPGEGSAEDIERLERCMAELVTLLAVPPVWSAGHAARTARRLVKALLGMTRLDFIYVRMNEPTAAAPIEVFGVAHPSKPARSAREIGNALEPWLGEEPRHWPVVARNPVGDGDMSIVPLGLGLKGELGAIVGGSQRPDFPRAPERLLLRVAATQTSIALQDARHRGQRRRFTDELAKRVAQRTAELAATNEKLRVELADRKLVENTLRDSDSSSRLIINTLPATAWSTHPDGYCDFLSQRWLEYAGLSAAQAEGWGWRAVIHPEDVPSLVEHWQSCLTSGAPVDAEARMRRADGVYRWFLFRANPLRDHAGKIVKWYGTNIDVDDRKRAEEALRASELNLRELTETIPEMLWSATAQGAIDYCNARFLHYTGFSAQEVMADGWTRIIHPEDFESAARAWLSSVATGSPYQVEVRTFHAADHSYRWCTVSALPLVDEQQRILKWHGTAVDVHDRKLAQEELRQSERDTRLIVDCIPAQVAVLGPTGEVKLVNRRMADYFGGAVEAVGNWKTGNVVPPDELPRVLAGMAKAFETNQPFELENHLRRFDGVYRWFQVRGLPLLDSAGRAVRWYFLIADIEERKQAEEALRRSEAFLAEAQRISSTGSFSWHPAADEVFFSEELCRIFEFDKTEKIALDQIGARVHPDDMLLLTKLIDEIRGSGGSLEYEMRLRMPDGRVKYIRTFGSVIHHPDGRRECLGAMQDVTQRHLSDEALDKARSELAYLSRSMSLGALTASIAHEVNQPLSGIITNASTCVRLLTAEPPNVARALETAHRMIRDSTRAADVVGRLRALFGRKAVAIETVDLNDAAREVISLLASDLQRNRVVLRPQLDDDTLLVTGDRVQLQQVILNLVRNASDAMSSVEDRPRQLLIKTARDEGDHVRLMVQDAGIGLDPADMDRLFDAFYTTKNEGMGVGLSISRSIIETHRGRLWATANEGPGATFVFSIPRRTEGEADAR